MKKLSDSSVRGWRTEKKKVAIKKRRIDYSDIPPLSDKQLASMRRVGRPPLGEEPRRLIAIRLDVRVLRWLKSLAAKHRVSYQSLSNELFAGGNDKSEVVMSGFIASAVRWTSCVERVDHLPERW